MKKTRSKKKLGTIVLAMAMSTSMAMTALAVQDPQPSIGESHAFEKNKADTTVNLVGMNDSEISGNLAATVPLTVALAVSASGTITGPTNYSITNTSKEKKISVIKVTATSMKPDTYVVNGVVSGKQVDLKNISMTPSGITTATKLTVGEMGATAGHVISWTLQPNPTGNVTGASVNLTFGGSIPDVTKLPVGATGSASGDQAFKLSYVIALATNQ